MSINHRTVSQFPETKTFTVTLAALVEILIPTGARSITVCTKTDPIWIYQSGIDGGAPPASDRASLLAGGTLKLKMGNGSNRRGSVLVSSEIAASTEISFTYED